MGMSGLTIPLISDQLALLTSIPGVAFRSAFTRASVELTDSRNVHVEALTPSLSSLDLTRFYQLAPKRPAALPPDPAGRLNAVARRVPILGSGERLTVLQLKPSCGPRRHDSRRPSGPRARRPSPAALRRRPVCPPPGLRDRRISTGCKASPGTVAAATSRRARERSVQALAPAASSRGQHTSWDRASPP
jgi:hypothetical protein